VNADDFDGLRETLSSVQPQLHHQLYRGNQAAARGYGRHCQHYGQPPCGEKWGPKAGSWRGSTFARQQLSLEQAVEHAVGQFENELAAISQPEVQPECEGMAKIEK
jgi:hypothetical protein